MRAHFQPSWESCLPSSMWRRHVASTRAAAVPVRQITTAGPSSHPRGRAGRLSKDTHSAVPAQCHQRKGEAGRKGTIDGEIWHRKPIDHDSSDLCFSSPANRTAASRSRARLCFLFPPCSASRDTCLGRFLCIADRRSTSFHCRSGQLAVSRCSRSSWGPPGNLDGPRCVAPQSPGFSASAARWPNGLLDLWLAPAWPPDPSSSVRP